MELKKIAQIYLDHWSDEINAGYALYLIRLELGLTDAKLKALLGITEELIHPIKS